MTFPDKIHCHNGDVFAEVQSLKFGHSKLDFEIGKPETQPGGLFTYAHMRLEPPVDEGYLAIAQLLDFMPSTCTVLNTPKSLIHYNEKLLPLLFPEDSVLTLVTSQIEKVVEARQRFGAIILKPMNLFGGKGIYRVEDDNAAAEKTALMTQKGQRPIIVQPFLPQISDGEVRVFTSNGTAKAWCLKKPAPGEFLANTSNQATLEDFKPTKELEQRVSRVAAWLLQRGIYFSGMDIIDHQISEINITSPRLLSTSDTTAVFDEIATEILKLA